MGLTCTALFFAACCWVHLTCVFYIFIFSGICMLFDVLNLSDKCLGSLSAVRMRKIRWQCQETEEKSMFDSNKRVKCEKAWRVWWNGTRRINKDAKNGGWNKAFWDNGGRDREGFCVTEVGVKSRIKSAPLSFRKYYIHFEMFSSKVKIWC